MERREFLKISGGGLAAIAVGGLRLPPIFRSEAFAAAQTIELTMEEAQVEMVDLTQVYMWLFGSPALGPSFPGPAILTTQGHKVTIRLTNNLDEPHAFQIVGTTIASPPVNPGQTTTLKFKAPAAGTYLYVDPLNAPVNRVLGLHGPLIVLPKPKRIGKKRKKNPTPYSAPTPNVLRLFRDLGNSPQFPGDPWLRERTKIWLFSSIDPAFNALAEAGQPIDPLQFTATFLPRYFTINGKSGAFAAHDQDIVPHGNIGEPHLIRILNAGMAAHSPHIHGNHVYVLSVNNTIRQSALLVDTFTVAPADRVDWLLPFIRPQDIPGDPTIPLRDLLPTELALSANELLVAQSPIRFPMHCHMEMSQTAAGGNYNQGAVTDWTLTGDLDKLPFPNQANLALLAGNRWRR